MTGHAPGAPITGKEPSPDPAACPPARLASPKGLRRCKGERDLGEWRLWGGEGRETLSSLEEEARMDGACASSGPEGGEGVGDPQAHCDPLPDYGLTCTPAI